MPGMGPSGPAMGSSSVRRGEICGRMIHQASGPPLVGPFPAGSCAADRPGPRRWWGIGRPEVCRMPATPAARSGLSVSSAPDPSRDSSEGRTAVMEEGGQTEISRWMSWD